MKVCSKCKLEKELDQFGKNSRSKDKLEYYCKQCHSKISREGNIKRKDIINKQRRDKRALDPEYREKQSIFKKRQYWKNREAHLLIQAKQALKRRNIICTITIDDIIIPEICPVFKIPLDKGRFSPSLDRIDNSKGYIPGNVWVISRLANTMKNDGSLEEILTFCENLSQFIKNKMI